MFQLMLKDNVCAEFDITDSSIATELTSFKVVGILPINCTERNFVKWLESRNASKHREHLSAYLNKLGIFSTYGYLKVTHGISINDCFWVRDSAEAVNWKDVSPYTNEYNEVIQRLAFDGVGLYGEELSPTSPEFGTSGTFDKCWVREDGNIFMIKRGSDIASNSGLEPYCEVLASQVFSSMRAGIPYKLIKYHDKIASKCKLFNNEDRSFIPYGNLGRSTDTASILRFYDDLNSDIFRRILVCDALTLNIDRHIGNHGVFYSSEEQRILSAAPGYDYNLSMCPYLTRDDFADFPANYVKYMPKFGMSFIAVAREVMTPSIRRDLINLKGIKLELPFYTKEFQKERCEWMSELVNIQIENILSGGEIKAPEFHVDKISNCMRYRLKLGLTEDQWVTEVPRLMKIFEISRMEELEQEIAKLI